MLHPSPYSVKRLCVVPAASSCDVRQPASTCVVCRRLNEPFPIFVSGRSSSYDGDGRLWWVQVILGRTVASADQSSFSSAAGYCFRFCSVRQILIHVSATTAPTPRQRQCHVGPSTKGFLFLLEDRWSFKRRWWRPWIHHASSGFFSRYLLSSVGYGLH